MVEFWVEGLADGLMVILLYLAVKEYKKEDFSVRKVVQAAAGAYLCTCIGFMPREYNIAMHGVVWLPVLLLPGLVLAGIFRKSGRTVNGRSFLKYWLICDGLLWLWSWYEIPFVWRYFCYLKWENLLMICLPMVWAAVYRSWKKYTAIGYFGTCLLIYMMTNTLFCMVQELAPSEIQSIYFMLLCVIVYVMERRHSPENGENGLIQVLAAVGYIGISSLILFWQNPRVREVFYHLGGAAYGIDVPKRENWLGYRLSAFQYTMDHDLDIVILRLVFNVFIILLVNWLLKKNRTDMHRYHAAKLFSVSYLVRAVMHVLAVLGGFSIGYIMKMPFTYLFMEAAVLGIFLWERKKDMAFFPGKVYDDK